MNGLPKSALEEKLLTGYTGRLLGVLAAGSFVAFLGRGVIPPLLPAIVEDLSISSSEAGVGLSLLWMAYAASHYPGGRLSDELTRKTTLMYSLGIMVVGFAMLISTFSFLSFIAGLVFIGFGHGVYYPSARGLIGDMFLHRRSQAIGVQMSATAAGATLAAGLAVVALSVAKWQTAFVPVVVGLLVILFLLHRWSKEPYRHARVTLELDQTILRLIGSRRILLVLIAYTAFSMTWQGTVSFLPTFLHVDKGFSLAIGSTAYALIYGVGMVVSPLAGRIGDVFPRTQVAIANIFVCMVGFAILVFAGSPLLVIGGVVILATGMWGFPPAVQAVLLSEFPKNKMGADLGGFKTIFTGIGAIGPAYVGFVADWSSYTIAYAGFLPGLLVSLLALGVLLWE